MPLDKKVTLASFQENMLSHKTVFLSLCRRLWEDKLLYTLVPAARLFSRAACLAISHGTGVSKSCSRRVSFWDWGEYYGFSKVVGLVAAFGARVEIIFAHILVFPACAIEVQHINENSPTILKHNAVWSTRCYFQRQCCLILSIKFLARGDVNKKLSQNKVELGVSLNGDIDWMKKGAR